jgi:hypothetical protein
MDHRTANVASPRNGHPGADSAAPVRVQRRRTKGWRMPPNTVSVTRPGRWGNPFFSGSGLSMGGFDDDMNMVNPPPTPANCVKWFRKRLETLRLHEPEIFEAYIAPLRGKNLACWCATGEPCHANVLLNLASQPVCEAV